jgi:7,8-dihydropterin-6-yl-methyl-4-(beta-D-ribofuranosyl)aminobenzene 5'-phosphate synthase
VKLTVLSENTSVSDALEHEHGLSIHIEAPDRCILFDTGAGLIFRNNARKLGVDLSKVDLLVISHGHSDHGGGLRTFLEVNSHAKIYLHKQAFEAHYSRRPEGVADIGLDQTLLPNERFVFCGDQTVIDENIEAFSRVKSKRFFPSCNATLLMKHGDELVTDDFAHEQNLVIQQDGKTMLIAGCAHKGIVNIVNAGKDRRGQYPDYVVGGFHLSGSRGNQSEASDVVDAIGEYLASTPSRYFTCHCTGMENVQRLSRIMGEKIQYLSTGDRISIEM